LLSGGARGKDDSGGQRRDEPASNHASKSMSTRQSSQASQAWEVSSLWVVDAGW
jgi:hypothetical protein